MSYALCQCGSGEQFDDEQYSSCFSCYTHRRAGYIECIFCGKWHTPRYSTCFTCRAKRRDEAGRDLRIDIQLRDGFQCQRCGNDTGLLHIDHIKPCSAGGTADLWNLQVLCHKCNLDKGTAWGYGSRYDQARIRLMHLYFTYGWCHLDEEERSRLQEEATRYPGEFSMHSRSTTGPAPPASDDHYEALMAEFEQGSQVID